MIALFIYSLLQLVLGFYVYDHPKGNHSLSTAASALMLSGVVGMALSGIGSILSWAISLL